ncbi:type VII secretion target [Actinokineospora cianjurensis]|uniref:Excreted virulence factor EspC (Type VII ESX diderm) n=1 Tax=Actinokineospora cianjurensis TaxID=585224 RepID=A0A421AYU0_9PSEU|nr:type VII secretion target [Actinokineospora cianjurensis]RLK54961.1 excreted virulence factor EspC (type VII ESX diderm) [Actinokineospora cianjurensis]
MSGFDINLGEVRAHAGTVATISNEVNGALKIAQATVSGNAYGAIGSFFAAAIALASADVREAITKTAKAYSDVQDGLRAVVADYQEIDDAHARVFGGGDGTVQPAQATPGQQPYSPLQRQKAIEVLERVSAQHPISVATVALPPVKALKWGIGETASGSIGDHYEKDVAHVLAKPPTDANLRELAVTETKFWNSERGNWAGSMLTAENRYDLLVLSRHVWLAEMPMVLRAHVRQQLGL